MPALTPNIENRVRKLPKPSNATQSLQPLFEAVSNAMFGIEDRYGEEVGKGRIDITVSKLSDPSAIQIVIADDGIGLDAERYAAFCEIDTDFKKSKGGKGVGRLFWLDAFDQIEVDSTYGFAGATAKRVFSFVLNNTEQVVPTIQDDLASPEADRGTRVHFRGIRTKEYAEPFPKRADTFLRYFSAHFIADFLMGGGPTILLDVDGDAAEYPTYGFDDDDTQLGRVPLHAATPEEFASYLVKFQIRRDEERQDTLQRLIDALDSDGRFSFQDSIVEAARGIQASEQLALAQHVVRRKLALELLEKLIARIRVREGTSDDFHLERTLHSFICPMNVRGDDPTRLEGRAHELWIVDERLAFTRAFSSDKRLDGILVSGGSADRPDLFLWDLAHGLGSTDPDQSDAVDLSEPLSSVMVVEFKKPGRRTYNGAKDQIEQQITRYLAQLQDGEIESFGRTRVRIARDCVFHCYVVADIVGDLVLQLSGWDTTSNGQGRIRQLKGDYRGQIEVVQWQDLVNDAWMRNRATLHAAGLSRKRLTPLQTQPSHSEAIEDGEPVD